MRWLLVLVVLAAVGCTPCIDGNGVIVMEDRAVESFDSVDIRGKLDVVITRPTVDQIAVSGSSILSGTVSGEDVVITKGGLSKLNLTIAADSLSYSSSGSSQAMFYGEVSSFDIKTSGGTDIVAEDLIAKDVRIDASGTGKYYVHATKTLDVAINGLGSVYYKGEPQVTKTSSGSGTIEKIIS